MNSPINNFFNFNTIKVSNLNEVNASNISSVNVDNSYLLFIKNVDDNYMSSKISIDTFKNTILYNTVSQYAENADTASIALTASYTDTASYAYTSSIAFSSSYTDTASYANDFTAHGYTRIKKTLVNTSSYTDDFTALGYTNIKNTVVNKSLKANTASYADDFTELGYTNIKNTLVNTSSRAYTASYAEALTPDAYNSIKGGLMDSSSVSISSSYADTSSYTDTASYAYTASHVESAVWSTTSENTVNFNDGWIDTIKDIEVLSSSYARNADNVLNATHAETSDVAFYCSDPIQIGTTEFIYPSENPYTLHGGFIDTVSNFSKLNDNFTRMTFTTINSEHVNGIYYMYFDFYVILNKTHATYDPSNYGRGPIIHGEIKKNNTILTDVRLFNNHVYFPNTDHQHLQQSPGYSATSFFMKNAFTHMRICFTNVSLEENSTYNVNISLKNIMGPNGLIISQPALISTLTDIYTLPEGHEVFDGLDPCEPYYQITKAKQPSI